MLGVTSSTSSSFIGLLEDTRAVPPRLKCTASTDKLQSCQTLPASVLITRDLSQNGGQVRSSEVSGVWNQSISDISIWATAEESCRCQMSDFLVDADGFYWWNLKMTRHDTLQDWAAGVGRQICTRGLFHPFSWDINFNSPACLHQNSRFAVICHDFLNMCFIKVVLMSEHGQGRHDPAEQRRQQEPLEPLEAQPLPRTPFTPSARFENRNPDETACAWQEPAIHDSMIDGLSIICSCILILENLSQSWFPPLTEASGNSASLRCSWPAVSQRSALLASYLPTAKTSEQRT